MFKKISGFLLLSFSACVFAENQAAYQPGQYYFAPGVAYYHFSDKRDLQNAALINMSAGYVVTEQLSLEAFYGQAATETKPTNNNDDSRFYTYWMDGVYHFQSSSESNIHPYVLAGLGVTTQDDTVSSTGNTSLLSVNAGLGIEYFVSPSISVYTDARDIYTLNGGKDDWMLNAGVKFLFGDTAGTEKIEAEDKPIDTSGTTGFYQLQDSSRVEG